MNNKWNNFLLNEITLLPKGFYRELRALMLSSNFWEQSNYNDDVKNNQTPMSHALSGVIQEVLHQKGFGEIEARIRVRKDIEKPEEKESYLAGGSHHVTSKGKEFIEVWIHPFFEESEFEYNTFATELSEVISHELVHAIQLRKQAKNKGLKLAAATKERSRDTRQIPNLPEDHPEYNQEYYSRPIEIEAYAAEIALYLLKVVGKNRAIKYLSMSLDNPALPDWIKNIKIFQELKNRPKASNRLRNRLFQYIEILSND